MTSGPRPGREVAVVQSRVGVDGRSRVLATLIAMVNERGATPDLLTFSPEQEVERFRRFAGQPLAFVHRRMPRPPAARGYALAELALPQIIGRAFPAHRAYIALTDAPYHFPPTSHVLRYIAFPAHLARHIESRYQRQPLRAYGAFVAWRYGRAAGHPFGPGTWVANSEFTRAAATGAYGLSPREIDTVYGPVDLTPGPEPARKRAQVVSLGAFHPDKRQLDQIAVAASLPDVPFRMLGAIRSPRYFAACAARASEVGNVELVADASAATVRQALLHSAVFLHTKHNEHQGLSTVEGIASGCVPVVHDSGGQREVVPIPGLRFRTPQEAAAIIDRQVGEDGSPHLPELREHARRFGAAAFRAGMARHVDAALAAR